MKSESTSNEKRLEALLRAPLSPVDAPPHVRTRVMARLRSEANAPKAYSLIGARALLLALTVLIGAAVGLRPKAEPVNLASAMDLPARSASMALTTLPRLEETARATYHNEWQKMRSDLQEVEGFLINRLPRFAGL